MLAREIRSARLPTKAALHNAVAGTVAIQPRAYGGQRSLERKGKFVRLHSEPLRFARVHI